MIFVLDASVAIKWYVNEIYTPEAEKLLGASYELCAPELIITEVGNILWKKIRRNELTIVEGSKIVDDFLRRINLHSHVPIIKAAYTGAAMSGQTVYDWTYLALAVSISKKFVTADVKFYAALQTTNLAKHLIWVGDL